MPPPLTAALAVPVTLPEPPPEVLPQPAQPPSPKVPVAPPRHRPKPGELVCGQCGTGNLASRKFCSRCGESLSSAVVVGTPWWRRVFRRRVKVLELGGRPSKPGEGRTSRALRGTFRKVRVILSVSLLVFGLLAALYPPVRTFVVNEFQALKTKVSSLADDALSPIRPATTSATAQTAGHPVQAAFDTFKNTYWAAPWSLNQPPVITVQLAQPVELRMAIVTSGAAGEYTAHGRPSSLKVSYSNEKFTVVSLKDSPQPQQVELADGLGATSLQISVLAVYGTQPVADVAITEIELFGLA
ncbi:NADase-type glycan-binding domain-containing protein [Actinosynnema sp. ALI-1.44]|uniref:NADase-type glycan-binding domain-containing protein n=1 Tax=Actinosynnema sp. ALI-1.44 TaxID=1933779 RepID=UPI00143D25E4|nr:discoidin domain-containing protein [Actinosynnema sp. ALI-1.44]